MQRRRRRKRKGRPGAAAEGSLGPGHGAVIKKSPAAAQVIRAMARLYHARQRIIETAARWQAAGIDTAPLTAPLVEIQEALAELEAVDVQKMAGDVVKALGRSLGNHFNALRVSGAGLETEDVAARRVRWLDLLEDAADQCIRIVDRMEALLDDE